jgi:hypothetical protein
VFKFRHDVLTRALERTGALGRAGFRYSSLFSFVICENLFSTDAAKGARVQSADADGTRSASKDQFLDDKCASQRHQRCR